MNKKVFTVTTGPSLNTYQIQEWLKNYIGSHSDQPRTVNIIVEVVE